MVLTGRAKPEAPRSGAVAGLGAVGAWDWRPRDVKGTQWRTPDYSTPLTLVFDSSSRFMGRSPFAPSAARNAAPFGQFGFK